MEADRAPVASSASGSPGSALPDGFVVADGSTLVGGAIPTGVTGTLNGVPVADQGWTALLVVDGDAEDVVENYIAQAEAQGLHLRQPPEMVTVDGEPIVIGPPGHTWARCAGAANSDYVCGAHLQSVGRTSPRSVSIELTRGGTPERPLSHAVVTYATTDLAWEHGGSDAFGDPAAIDPDAPSSWPTPPSAGESLDSGQGPLGDLTVEPGSEVAGPPYGDGYTATLAVLEVTDDPEAVLDAYRSQLAELLGASSVGDVERLVVDADTTLDTLRAGEVGGRAVPPENGAAPRRTYVAVGHGGNRLTPARRPPREPGRLTP